MLLSSAPSWATQQWQSEQIFTDLHRENYRVITLVDRKKLAASVTENSNALTLNQGSSFDMSSRTSQNVFTMHMSNRSSSLYTVSISKTDESSVLKLQVSYSYACCFLTYFQNFVGLIIKKTKTGQTKIY